MLTAATRTRDFPTLAGMTYLNTAAESIPPRCVGEALAQYWEDKQRGMRGRDVVHRIADHHRPRGIAADPVDQLQDVARIVDGPEEPRAYVMLGVGKAAYARGIPTSKPVGQDASSTASMISCAVAIRHVNRYRPKCCWMRLHPW